MVLNRRKLVYSLAVKVMQATVATAFQHKVYGFEEW